MPLVSKRKREVTVDSDRKTKRARTSSTKELREYENIGYQEDHWHTIIRSIPEDSEDFKKVVCQHICSFLNGAGGILCFGCRSNGRVYGENISRKEEDNLRLIIDGSIKRFHPFVSPAKYRITFTSVQSSSRTTRPQSKFVFEIRISPGVSDQLYETEFHEVYLRKDSSTWGPLTPQEIKNHVIQRYKKKLQNEEPLKSKPKALVVPYMKDSAPGDSIKPLSRSVKGNRQDNEKPVDPVLGSSKNKIKRPEHPLEKSLKASGCGNENNNPITVKLVTDDHVDHVPVNIETHDDHSTLTTITTVTNPTSITITVTTPMSQTNTTSSIRQVTVNQSVTQTGTHTTSSKSHSSSMYKGSGSISSPVVLISPMSTDLSVTDTHQPVSKTNTISTTQPRPHTKTGPDSQSSAHSNKSNLETKTGTDSQSSKDVPKTPDSKSTGKPRTPPSAIRKKIAMMVESRRITRSMSRAQTRSATKTQTDNIEASTTMNSLSQPSTSNPQPDSMKPQTNIISDASSNPQPDSKKPQTNIKSNASSNPQPDSKKPQTNIKSNASSNPQSQYSKTSSLQSGSSTTNIKKSQSDAHSKPQSQYSINSSLQSNNTSLVSQSTSKASLLPLTVDYYESIRSISGQFSQYRSSETTRTDSHTGRNVSNGRYDEHPLPHFKPPAPGPPPSRAPPLPYCPPCRHHPYYPPPSSRPPPRSHPPPLPVHIYKKGMPFPFPYNRYHN